MSRFIEGQSRAQSTLFPEVLDDYIHEDNPICAFHMFINSLDLSEMGFARYQPKQVGHAILRQPSSRFTFTVILIAFDQADI